MSALGDVDDGTSRSAAGQRRNGRLQSTEYHHLVACVGKPEVPRCVQRAEWSGEDAGYPWRLAAQVEEQVAVLANVRECGMAAGEAGNPGDAFDATQFQAGHLLNAPGAVVDGR